MKTVHLLYPEYVEYIKKHVANVQLVWEKLQPYLNNGNYSYRMEDFDIHDIERVIKVHDESKWSGEEFYGYAQWFFQKDGEDKCKVAFDYAWNHHQKHNPHHPEYWVMHDGTILDMPFNYIIDMLCDWSAMSVKFRDTPSQFYTKKWAEMPLLSETRKCIDRWLPLFDKVVSDINKEALK